MVGRAVVVQAVVQVLQVVLEILRQPHRVKEIMVDLVLARELEAAAEVGVLLLLVLVQQLELVVPVEMGP